MALYKTEGIILGSCPFEESGKLVTVFTKEHGKISVIAKGAKRPTSRFGGRLETFSYGELLLAKGRNLDILSQMELRESFQSIREDHTQLNLGFYFIKIIQAATMQRQRNPKLFKLLLLSLKKMKDGAALDYVVRFFEINLLKAEGVFRADQLPEEIISEHLDKDIKLWKKMITSTVL
ncbi:DNA repair protein RecO [Candidatus Margulisiibacteriota bacterium]